MFVELNFFFFENKNKRLFIRCSNVDLLNGLPSLAFFFTKE